MLAVTVDSTIGYLPYFTDQNGQPISGISEEVSGFFLSIDIPVSNVSRLGIGCDDSGSGPITLFDARFLFGP